MCFEMVANGSKGRVKESLCPYWGDGCCKYLKTNDAHMKWSDLEHKKKACNINVGDWA